MTKQDSARNTIAIDLGTRHSSVAYIDRRYIEDRPFLPRPVRLAADESSNFCVPSRVIYLKSGYTEVGNCRGGRSLESKYYSGQQSEIDRIVEEFKLELCQPHGGDRTRHPWKAAREVVAFLKKAAENEVGTIDRAVIAVPSNPECEGRAASFQSLLRDIGVGADIVDETIASLCYVDFVEGGLLTNKPKYVMVIDYGGGTCNVTIAQISYPLIMFSPYKGRLLEHISSKSSEVGGKLIDKACADWIRRCYSEAVTSFSDIELKNWARKTKETICRRYSTLEEETRIPIVPGQEEPCWTLSTFDNVIRSSVSRILEPIGDAIEEASSKEGEGFRVEAVFMVGGSSNVPLAETVVREYFGEEGIGGDVADPPNIHCIRPKLVAEESPDTLAPPRLLEYEEDPLQVIRDPRLAVSCGAALHSFYRQIGHRTVIGKMPVFLELELSHDSRRETLTLLKKHDDVPTRRPQAHIIRVPKTREITLTLMTRSEEESSLDFFAEHKFTLEQAPGRGLLRIDVDVDVCRRVRLSVRPYTLLPGKDGVPFQTTVLPGIVGG